MFSSIEDYAAFVHSILATYPSVRKSTLTLYSVGPQEAKLSGELYFDKEIVLRVTEIIDFRQQLIRRYSYAVRRGPEPLYWYDPQPHPNNPVLATTFPHHKHIPPDIKHNRVPAPGLNWNRPNLPYLITEIQQTLLS